MTRGLLQVTGTIDITQFWPQPKRGGSDGDTVYVQVDPDGFEFSPDGDPKHLKVTRVFDDAIVHGRTQEKIVKNGRIDVRLEHIDATELHYEGFRQYFGETAAVELHEMIARSGQQFVPCKVQTRINEPNDAFDCYGRLIGNIIIRLHARDVNVNHELVQGGFAFPAFYNSALVEEIKEVSQLAEQAKKAGKNIWKHLSFDVGHPDFSLHFHAGETFKPQNDIGPVVIPKLFRRLVAWHLAVQKGEFSGTFPDFLAQKKHKNEEDGWVKTSDFLRNPGITPSAHNLASLVDKHGMFTLGPAEIVFFESPATLFDAKGKKIVSFGAAFEKAA